MWENKLMIDVIQKKKNEKTKEYVLRVILCPKIMNIYAQKLMCTWN